jgi:predicted PurR-regulated permease PerM
MVPLRARLQILARRHESFYRACFALTVSALLALALYWMLAPFWGALAWGVCLAFLLTPAQRWLTRKLNGYAGISAGVITLLVPVVLIGPIVSLSVSFADQVVELTAHLHQQPLRFNANLLAQLERYEFIGSLTEWLRQNLTATTDQLQGWIVDAARLMMQSAAWSGGNFLFGAIGSVIHFFMMLFLLFFFLRDGQQLLSRVVRLVPMEPGRRKELFESIGATTHAVIYGTGMTAAGQGVLIGIGFAIAGLPSAVLFGVVGAVVALLPFGGAALVWVPAVVYLAATSEWGWAVFMFVWGTGVSLSDNLVRPLLISGKGAVPIPIIFVGIIGGISAFGLIGAIIGPVLLAAIATLLRFLDETLVRDHL